MPDYKLQSYDNNISLQNKWEYVRLVKWGSAEEEQKKKQRDRLTTASQCVGLYVINQSLVRLPHYSDLFVFLPQMFSFSPEWPRVSIVGRPGARMTDWKGKGARPERLRFTTGETQLLHWNPTAWRGLGLIDSCWMLLHCWLMWTNYQGRDANVPFPL